MYTYIYIYICIHIIHTHVQIDICMCEFADAPKVNGLLVVFSKARANVVVAYAQGPSGPEMLRQMPADDIPCNEMCKDQMENA